jgi:hypothetical protein
VRRAADDAGGGAMILVNPPDRRGQMTMMDTAQQRLQEADGLAAVLT